MKRRPRLGIHCPGSGTGGPWRYVHSLLRQIDLNEFDVRLFCDIDGVYEPRPEIRTVMLAGRASDGASLQRTPSLARQTDRRLIPRQAKLVAGFIQTARRLARVIQPHDLDLFHTQNAGCEEAPFAARLAGIPRIVGTFHVAPSTDIRRERDGFEYQFLERLSNGSLTAAIPVSAAASRDWRRRTFLPSPRVITIHNGIDAEKFQRRQSREEARRQLNLPATALIVVALGRLEEAKGFADLIDAAALLRPGLPNLLVAIAGEGPLRTALEEHAQHRGANVRYLGFQPDVQPVLDAADLCAMPSLSETFGYAAAEAMAAGLPVLASAVGGLPEVIGDAGVLLPPRNAPAWAAAIQRLAADPLLCETLGNAGRQRVRERFEERTMARRTFALYRKLLAARPR